MPKCSLLALLATCLLAIAGGMPAIADDDVQTVQLAGGATRAAGADGGQDVATPSPAPASDNDSAAKPHAVAVETTPDGPCGCLNCCPCPRVYFDVEALFLRQVNRFRDQPIVVDAITGTTYQSTSDLTFGTDPGLQATFGVRLCDCCGLEFTYLGLFQNDASALTQQTDPASFLIFPNNFAGNVFGNGMSQVQTNYSTYLNSFELNWACCCGCCCCTDTDCGECGCSQAACGDSGRAHAACGDVCCRSVEWFAGLRYLDIGNDLNIAVQRDEFGGVENGSYTIHAGNRLFGGQVGGRLRRTFNRFGWELTGKAGIYDNAAEQTQTVIDFPNFPLRPTTTTQGDDVAFVGELNLSGVYRLTNALWFKAGFNVIWIEGLALAPDQLDFNFAASPSGNQLTTTGGMFLYGANVGLEARW
jgi:hypothetical protein